jgi:hypothetical protein
MLKDIIEKILREKDITTYKLDTENLTLLKNNSFCGGGFVIRELIDITSELSNQNISYSLDSNQNIIIENN